MRLGGFYGRERVSLGKRYMMFFKKQHVGFKKATCCFLQNIMLVYPRQAQNVPKKGWNRTIFAGGGDFFLGLKSVAEGASICVENMV